MSETFLTAAIIAFLFIGCGRLPREGDVYVEYIDDREDQYALTNGFPAESVAIHKVVKVESGTVYCAVFRLPITNTGTYPFPYNEFGPASNFRKYKEYRTLVKPNP